MKDEDINSFQQFSGKNAKNFPFIFTGLPAKDERRLTELLHSFIVPAFLSFIIFSNLLINPQRLFLNQQTIFNIEIIMLYITMYVYIL